MTSQAVLVKSDDWQALFVDGKSVIQSHRITLEDFAIYIPNHTFGELGYAWVTDEYYNGYMMDSGRMHSNLEDVDLDGEIEIYERD